MGLNKILINALIIIIMLASGCASSRSGQVYSRDQARQAHTIKMGTVEVVRPVSIEGTSTGIGAIAGGAAGGALGSTVGGGSGKTVATVFGAVAGGLAGAGLEKDTTKKEGLEITVKLDDGDLLAVVQEADESFSAGDRVRVLKGTDGTVRVRH